MSKAKLIMAEKNGDKIKFYCTVCDKESPEYDVPASVDAMNQMANSFGEGHKKCKRLLGDLK